MENKRIIHLSLAFILLTAFLVRAYPFFLGSFADSDPFYHARMSRSIIENGFLPQYDYLSMQGRPYTYSPLFHVSIAAISLITGFDALTVTGFYPVFYGVLAVLLVFILARRLFQSDKIALFSALALAAMSLHIVRTNGYARPDALAITLIIAMFFFLSKKSFPALAFLCIFLSLLHPLSSLYFFGFLLASAFVHKVLKKDFPFAPAILCVILGALVFTAWLLSLNLPPQNYVSRFSLEASEMSNLSFLSFFFFLSSAWIFLPIGFLNLNERFGEKLLEKIWFIYSLAFGVFAVRLFLYFAPIAAIFAGIGMDFAFGKIALGEGQDYPKTSFSQKLEQNSAVSQTARGLPLRNGAGEGATPSAVWREKIFFAFLFILLSAGIAAAILPISKHPDDKTLFAMEWAEENTSPDSVIAAKWDLGHIITGAAGRKSFIDGYFEFAPNVKERNESFLDLVQSSDCGTITGIAGDWNINYLFLHEKAKESKAYSRGILESTCPEISAVFDDGTRFLRIGD